MGSHWTCCTPRQLPGLERSTLSSDNEWDELYHKAETLFHTNRTTFDQSIRHQLVKSVLLDAYKSTGREFSSMPLACDRNKPNREYVEWTCPATILGDLSEPNNDNELFELRANTQRTKLQLDTATGQVAWAVVSDLLNDKTYAIKAKKYVVCAGAVLTPGILVNSGLDKQLPALVSLPA
jgi:pyranose oxidase